MTQTPTTHAYAQRLRALADHLDAQPDLSQQTMLRALVDREGLLPLAGEMAATVHTDLAAWDEALRADSSSAHLSELRQRIADNETVLLDVTDEAALHLSGATRLMANHRGPDDAAAAALAVEARLWDGPEVRGNERVHLLWPDGSSHAPQPGLAQTSRGYVDPFGTAKFTRAAAEQIVADMLADNVGFEAAFEADGSLVYSWPREHDGEGGRMHVVPDDRGLYEIGGQWPWDYRRPGNALPRAQAARITTRKTAPPSGPPEPGARYGSPVRAEGRTR
ncbi:hypothetical protein ACFVVU_30645 [Kitasatospora sp. NPDC057965]|uniref:hypothetical protein n=1 Tax=Kitasatospora sp. NPDC057965 TaxID=3346291 RepID=UPI0036D97DB9